MEQAIIAIAILFFLGHALKWFFIKTKIPDLLILVLIGYLAGPVFGYIDASDFGKVGGLLSTLALVVILYEGGLKLKTSDLVSSSLPAAGLSLIGFISITFIAFIVAWVFAKQEWHIALLLGLGMGSTSSAVVIPMVQFLSCRERTKTILSLESAFTDVLAIVCFLVITDGIVANAINAEDLIIGIGPKTISSILMGIGFGIFWAILRQKFKNFTSMTFSTESFVLLSYGLVGVTGFNGAMAVLALGFTLANLNLLPQWSHQYLRMKPISYKEMSLLGEISFLLKTIFFIYLGILIKFSNWQSVAIALVLSLMIFITRYFTVKAVYKKDKSTKQDAMVTVAMGPRGLACAVLATIPIQRGIVGGQWIQDVLFAIIPFSIILTAIFVMFSEQVNTRELFNKFFTGYLDKAPEETNEEVAEIKSTTKTISST